jgi:hypothetical protein
MNNSRQKTIRYILPLSRIIEGFPIRNNYSHQEIAIKASEKEIFTAVKEFEAFKIEKPFEYLQRNLIFSSTNGAKRFKHSLIQPNNEFYSSVLRSNTIFNIEYRITNTKRK